MTTGSSGAVAGFSALSPAAGPNAGNTYPMVRGERDAKIKLPKGSRKPWLDWLKQNKTKQKP